MPAIGVEEEPTRRARHRQAEMIANTLMEAETGRQAERCRQIDARGDDGVGRRFALRGRRHAPSGALPESYREGRAVRKPPDSRFDGGCARLHALLRRTR